MTDLRAKGEFESHDGPDCPVKVIISLRKKIEWIKIYCGTHRELLHSRCGRAHRSHYSGGWMMCQKLGPTKAWARRLEQIAKIKVDFKSG